MQERTAGFRTMILTLAFTWLMLGGCDWDALGTGEVVRHVGLALNVTPQGFAPVLGSCGLSFCSSTPRVYPDGSAELELRVLRGDFEGPVNVSVEWVEGTPHGVFLEGTTIPSDQDSASLHLQVASDAEVSVFIETVIRAEGPGGVSDSEEFRFFVAGRGQTSSSLAAGSEHTCSFNYSPLRRTYCWGANDAGQLGNGSTDGPAMPSEVVGDAGRFEQLAAGGNHTCALDHYGSASCWGANGTGQVGDGTRTNRLEPTRVKGGHIFSSIAAGGLRNGENGHTCGLLESGAALCWGSNASGQLGTGDVVDSAVPVLVAGGHNFHQLVTGATHTCGLAADGQAWCWGDNRVGQLGSDGESAMTPTAVSGGLEFIDLAAGDAHTCGLLPDGRAYCWGEGRHGQRGDGSTARRASIPTPVADDGRYSDIEAGGSHTCAVGTSDAIPTLSCWGANGRGQIGDDTPGDRASPARVFIGGSLGSVSGVAGLGLGRAHTCARALAGFAPGAWMPGGLGALFCWGDNFKGQLGVGLGLESSPLPLLVTFKE